MRKLIDEYCVSVSRAYAVCLITCSVVYYQAHGLRDDVAVRARIKEIAATTRVRYGTARIHVFLKTLRLA